MGLTYHYLVATMARNVCQRLSNSNPAGQDAGVEVQALRPPLGSPATGKTKGLRQLQVLLLGSRAAQAQSFPQESEESHSSFWLTLLW